MSEKSFFTNDEYNRTVKRKRLINIYNHYDISHIFGVLLGVLIALIPFLLSKELSDLFVENISVFLLFFFFFIFVIPCVIQALLYGLCGLGAYCLSKETEIWVVDFVEEIVYEAQLLSVDFVHSDFNRAEFKCKTLLKNDKISIVVLKGIDIYFSKDSAVNALNFIKSVNSGVLKKYYPDYENDNDFMEYFKDFQKDRMEQPYGLTSTNCFTDCDFRSCVLLDFAIINQYRHMPYFPYSLKNHEEEIENLFEKYIEEKKKEQRAIIKKQQIISYFEEINNLSEDDEDDSFAATETD